MKLRRNQVLDYIGFSPNWILRDEFYDIGSLKLDSFGRDKDTITCTKQQADLLYDYVKCPMYLEMIFVSSSQLVVHYRRYRTIIETLGSIGGSLNLIFTVFAIVTGIYLSSKRYEYVVNNVFPLLAHLKLDELDNVKYKDIKFDDVENNENCKLPRNFSPKLKMRASNQSRPSERIFSDNGLNLADIELTPHEFNKMMDRQDNERDLIDKNHSNEIRAFNFSDTVPEEPIGSGLKVLKSPNHPFSKSGGSPDVDHKKPVEKVGGPEIDGIGISNGQSIGVNEDNGKQESYVNIYEDDSNPLDIEYSLGSKLALSLSSCVSCCRKKRSTEDIKIENAMNYHKRALFESVQDSLDVITLVRELQTLKVLTCYLLEKHHFEATHLVGFKLWLEEKRYQKHEKKQISEILDNKEKSNKIGLKSYNRDTIKKEVDAVKTFRQAKRDFEKIKQSTNDEYDGLGALFHLYSKDFFEHPEVPSSQLTSLSLNKKPKNNKIDDYYPLRMGRFVDNRKSPTFRIGVALIKSNQLFHHKSVRQQSLLPETKDKNVVQAKEKREVSPFNHQGTNLSMSFERLYKPKSKFKEQDNFQSRGTPVSRQNGKL